MKVKIISASRVKSAESEALEKEYLKRLRFIQVEALPSTRKYADSVVQRKAEGEKLLKAAAGFNVVISLDEKGRLFSSEELSHLFELWIGQGKNSFALLIGGAYGLSSEVRNSSALVWSLSPLTFPFHIARLLAVEQIYRVFCNIHGHPYHK